jgi:hypothetical protein
MTATLRLFNAVLADDFLSEAVVKTEHGVVIAPNAAGSLPAILTYIANAKLSGEELNSTFYRSWNRVATVTLEQRLYDQISHYFSTYGLEALGIYDGSHICIPAEDLDVPEDLVLTVIRGLSREKLVGMCLDMLSSGIALKQETIADILEALSDLKYKFTGLEKVANREAVILIADKFGIMPSNPSDLFRYLVFKATGETLIVKNDKTISKIKSSRCKLPALSYKQKAAQAETFNKYKPLWLAFKASHVDNRSTVNQIGHLSKTLHKPQPVNVLANLTGLGDTFPQHKVEAAIKAANVFQLISTINAIRYYLDDNTSRVYSIRNGRKFAKAGSQPKSTRLKQHYQALMTELKSRLPQKKVYIPEWAHYNAPTSEKNFIGNMSEGTSIMLPFSSGTVMVGIHWVNAPHHRVDLDLSALAISGKVGWNSRWSNSDLMYSGDLTSAPAPNGASEWLYAKGSLTGSYNVVVNLFRGPMNHPFEIIIATADKDANIRSQYIVNPNNVICTSPAKMTERQLVLGTITPSPCGTGVVFRMSSGTSGKGAVSSFSEKHKLTIESLSAQEKTKLQLSELFDVVPQDEADVDLTPGNLAKNTLMDLFLTQG